MSTGCMSIAANSVPSYRKNQCGSAPQGCAFLLFSFCLFPLSLSFKFVHTFGGMGRSRLGGLIKIQRPYYNRAPRLHGELSDGDRIP